MEANYSKEEFLKGKIILIDKPYEWTSFDVVKKIRFLIKRKYKLSKIKVGHAGTLDPLATGLIIVCTGKATKQIQKLIDSGKQYEANIKLGATTPSFDRETDINKKFEIAHITSGKVKKILENKFKGIIKQVPPLYSAKRVNGVRAYELARRGEEIELKANMVEIKNIELIEYNLPDIKLYINCSKGTYIRSLARDIGVALKSGAYLHNLRRISIGNFAVQDAISIKEFEKNLSNYNNLE